MCVPFMLYTRLGHSVVNMNDATVVRSSVLVVEESDDKDFCESFLQAWIFPAACPLAIMVVFGFKIISSEINLSIDSVCRTN